MMQASAYTRRVERPDLLLVGALLHDIGKGRPGDHTVNGIEIVARLAPRMGFSPDDTDILVGMVRDHLLLTETAAWATPRQLTRAVRQAEVTIRPDPDLADEEERLVAGRGLFWRGRIAGLTEYRLLLDPEATAIVEAALDPLSAPRWPPWSTAWPPSR